MTAGTLSYGICSGAFLILTLWLLTGWRGKVQGGLLVVASGITTLWSGVAAAHAAYDLPTLLHGLELARDIGWEVFALALLRPREGGGWLAPSLRTFTLAIIAAVAALLAADLYLHIGRSALPAAWHIDVRALQYALLAVFGLVLTEQLLRNTRSEGWWSVKYLCLGLGGLFVYDFYLYADALMLHAIEPELWDARGIVNAFIAPMIAVTALRNPQWSLNIFMSRTVVFHAVGLISAGVYLLVMAGAGYYVRIYGGTWGGVAQVAFLFGAIVVLLSMLFSGQLRATVRVLFGKHFFSQKYDYREEWLRFMRTIDSDKSSPDVRVRAICALAQIAESTAGQLWLRNDQGDYALQTRWNLGAMTPDHEAAGSELVQFLDQRRWVIDLAEHRRDPQLYGGLRLPGWLADVPRAQLIVPLFHNDMLLGFVVLARPLAVRDINWEVRDLLKTIGRQVAGYLALVEANDKLLEARQFEAFNRLSAYVVHDLKNVVAQLSLIGTNAARHKTNPAFIDDAFNTVANAVNRMNRMLGQLRQDLRAGESAAEVNSLARVLDEACRLRAGQRPAPTLQVLCEEARVLARRDQLLAIFAHLVQNAQEATSADGAVTITLRCEDGGACIDIEDTGCGMDEEFIRDRLFKPFATTKGNAGMGIGAYEARDYVRTLGGTVAVTSQVGKGTRFCVRLPLAKLGGAAAKGEQRESA